MLRHRALLSFTLVLTAFLLAGGFILYAGSAHAQTGGIDQATLNNNFTCNNGAPSGVLFSTSGGNCSIQTGMFSRVMCIFENVLNSVLGRLYCGVQFGLQPAMGALSILFVVGLGIGFLTGMVRMTGRDVAIAFFKLMLVWAFAMNAEYGIQIGYRLFMGAVIDSGSIILSAFTSVPGALSQTGSSLLTAPDTLLSGIFSFFSGDAAPGKYTNSRVCDAQILLTLIAVFFLVPPLALLVIMFLITYLLLFAQALWGYLIALAMIAFLFTLAPIFISFALFSVTREFFEQWLGLLTSFALQILIVFAFLAMMMLVDLGTFFQQLFSLMEFWNPTAFLGPFKLPLGMCTVCEMERGPDVLDAWGNFISRGPILENGVGGMPTCQLNALGNRSAVPIWDFGSLAEFIKWVLIKLVALYILGKTMESFLKTAPDFARSLGGTPYATTLGGKSIGAGAASSSGVYMPGAQFLNEAATGFQQGWKQTSGFSTMTPTGRKAIGGLMGAATGAFLGSQSDEEHSRIRQAEKLTQYHRNRLQLSEQATRSAAIMRDRQVVKKNAAKAAYQSALTSGASVGELTQLRRQLVQASILSSALDLGHAKAYKSSQKQSQKLSIAHQRLQQTKANVIDSKTRRGSGLFGSMYANMVKPLDEEADNKSSSYYFIKDPRAANLRGASTGINTRRRWDNLGQRNRRQGPRSPSGGKTIRRR